MPHALEPFVDFKYGDNYASDFHLYRVSDGSRYNDNLIPTLTDKTTEVPGGDGMYFFNTFYKQRQFTINFAYDSLTEVDLRAIRNWLNGKEIKPLIFSEKPDRAYYAKVTGSPAFKYICFDEPINKQHSNNVPLPPIQIKYYFRQTLEAPLLGGLSLFISGVLDNESFNTVVISATSLTFKYDNTVINTINWDNTTYVLDVADQNSIIALEVDVRDNTFWHQVLDFTRRPSVTIPTQVIYKGEGSVQFTCYDPYAYSPTMTSQILTTPSTYSPTVISVGGTAPTPFKVTTHTSLSPEATIKIQTNNNSVLYFITIKETTATDSNDAYFEWDSSTGMIKARMDGIIRPIKFIGKSMGTLDVDTIPSIVTENITNNVALELNFYNRYI